MSDYPGTADGRFATLTVGHLELAIFPRMSFFEENCDTVMLNLPAGTLLTGDRPADGSHDSGDFAESQFPDGSPCWVAPGSYGVTDTDLVAAPVLDLISKDWGIVDIMRRFAVDLMRAGDSRKFARFHSAEVARRIYLRAVDCL